MYQLPHSSIKAWQDAKTSFLVRYQTQQDTLDKARMESS